MNEIFGTLFIIVLGCFGHFVYEMSNHNKFLGYFFAVNESTWEHLKLIIGPSFLWFIVEIHLYCGNENLFFSKFISLFFMIFLLPVMYYGYKYFLKKNYLITDILCFIITVILGQFLFHILINMNFSDLIFKHIGLIGLLIIFIKYITSTYVPNYNFIYKDPITHKYGIDGHSHE